jgi:hypothetical protein
MVFEPLLWRHDEYLKSESKKLEVALDKERYHLFDDAGIVFGVHRHD